MNGAPMARPTATCVLLALVMPVVSPTRVNAQAPTTSPSAQVRAEANDNGRPAGVLRGGVLSIHLVAQLAAWYPEAEDGQFKVVAAFGVAGRAPSVPGPLIRIPLGTTVDAVISNALVDTLLVFGMPSRSDTLRIAPNDTARVRFKPSAAGSFLYGASDHRAGQIFFGGSAGQLVGALIIDAQATPRDRVFVTTGWMQRPLSGPYFIAMNGKSWPFTEKFVHTVGDTVRWRVLNGGTGTAAHHPMHLHGFYYASMRAAAGMPTRSTAKLSGEASSRRICRDSAVCR